MIRLAALLAVVAVACLGCGSTEHAAPPADTTSMMGATTTSPYGDGYLLKPPVSAPSFSLADQTGTTLGAQDERGHWTVVTFMYTHCLDVCPLIANTLRTAMVQLPDLRVLAISVDPKNDTPSAVRTFLTAHRLPPKFHYLTGTRAELKPVWTKYNVAATGGPHATISHSSFEILVDPKGQERIYFDAQIKAADVVRDVKLLQN